MKKFLIKIWGGWKKFAFIIGNVITGLFLTAFYFSVFAIFAIPFRIFNRSKSKTSIFIVKKKTISTLEEFKTES